MRRLQQRVDRDKSTRNVVIAYIYPIAPVYEYDLSEVCVILQRRSQAQSVHDTPLETVRVGVVGCGFIARSQHLPSIVQHPRAVLVAVCDVHAEIARASAEQFGALAWYEDDTRMLADSALDLVVNCTPSPLHALITAHALKANCHVYSEKPLALELPAARQLIDQAAAAGLRLVVSPEVALWPPVMRLAALVRDGDLGEVHTVYARYGINMPAAQPVRSAWYYQHGGGALMDLGSYLVTALVAILGPVRNVAARTRTLVPRRITATGEFAVTVEDTALLQLEFVNGSLAAVQTGFSLAGGSGELTLELAGSRAMGAARGRDWFGAKVTCSLNGGLHELPPSRASSSVRTTGVGHTIDCVLAGRTPDLRPTDALHVLEVLLAAARSAREALVIPVTPPE